MSDRTKKFAEELDQLLEDGQLLFDAMQFDCYPDEFKEVYLKGLDGDKKALNAFLKKLPNVKDAYQPWYSKAYAVVKQILPDRLSDFVSYYEPEKNRKEISFQNYMIKDYLQGLRITRGWEKEVIADGSAAIPEFRQQLNIVKAAKDSLNSTLIDMKAVLQADLFDTEIESATALMKAGFLRAAGAVSGVVIEKHLRHLCEAHTVTIRKKHPSISDLIQLLRDADVITQPQWRFIQHLADIRNICDHAKDREPSKEEVADLIAGADKVLKTTF